MLENEARIKNIIEKINNLKASEAELKRERAEFLTKIDQLEKELKQKREKEKAGVSISNEEVKQELNRHIEEIDACLDLLKTI